MPNLRKRKISVKEKKTPAPKKQTKRNRSLTPDVRKRKVSVKEKKTPAPKKQTKKNRSGQPVKIMTTSKSVKDDYPMPQEIETELEDFADVSQEKVSIISIVKDLERQVATAFKLKETLEVDLDEAQKKLSEESAERARLEGQIEALEEQAHMVEQLRQDISYAEQERNKFANLLEEIQPQLETVTQERDLLAKKVASAEAHAKELEEEKTTFEAQILNLKDKVKKRDSLAKKLTSAETLVQKLEEEKTTLLARVADIELLRRELDEATKKCRDLNNQVDNLTSSLEASDTSRINLEKNVTDANETINALRAEVENHEGKLNVVDRQTDELQVELDHQRMTNRDLIEVKAQLESEMKKTNLRLNTAKNELEAFKKALRDIRSEATLTSGRVRQRYFKAQK